MHIASNSLWQEIEGKEYVLAYALGKAELVTYTMLVVSLIMGEILL